MLSRQELLDAIDRRDHEAVRRDAWGNVWALLATGWQPKQGCTLSEFRVYVDLLGNEEPDTVIGAIEQVADQWRPVPGHLLGVLRRQRSELSGRVDVGRGRHRTDSPDAIEAVRRAIDAGAAACECAGAPAARRWLISPDAVMRCGACDGIEAGQVFAVEDADVEEVAA